MLPLGTSAVTVGFGLLITMDGRPVDLRGSWVLILIAHGRRGALRLCAVPTLRSPRPAPARRGSHAGRLSDAVWREIDLPFSAAPWSRGRLRAAISLGEFGATSFLTRVGDQTMPIAIARLLGRPSALNLAQAYALATVLMALTLVAILAVDRLRGEAASF